MDEWMLTKQNDFCTTISVLSLAIGNPSFYHLLIPSPFHVFKRHHEKKY